MIAVEGDHRTAIDVNRNQQTKEGEAVRSKRQDYR